MSLINTIPEREKVGVAPIRGSRGERAPLVAREAATQIAEDLTAQHVRNARRPTQVGNPWNRDES